jgi:hypothetical protein
VDTVNRAELTAAHEALHESAETLRGLDFHRNPDLVTVLRLLGKAIEHTLNVVERLEARK